METANLAGLSQAGAPVMTRGSIARPTMAPASGTSMRRPVTVSGLLPRQSVSNISNSPLDVSSVNITIRSSVDTVNIRV